METAVSSELKFKISIRVFGRSLNTANSHSYLVDDVPTGTSSCIGELNVDIRSTNLKQLRSMIQFDRSGHMNKRSLMFQEALFIMGRLPNYFNRPTEDMNKYQFGFMNKKSAQDMRLISVESEETVISELIGATDFFTHDLLIVPLSQVSPN